MYNVSVIFDTISDKSHNPTTRKGGIPIMPVKYVFVTGGVVSGLGKGITAASLGRLLKARGYKVTMQKFDPTSTSTPAP